LIGGALLGSISVGAIELQTRATTNELSGGAAEQRRAPRSPPRSVVSERLAPALLRDAEASHVEVSASAVAPGAGAASPRGVTADTPHGSIRSEKLRTERSEVATVANAPISPGSAEPHTEDTGAVARAASAPAGRLLGTTDADQLLLEARALRQAQAALREGQAARALELIEQQAGVFGAGALNEERNAVRLLASCALGRASRAEIDRFLATSGSSPLAARVRSACSRR
jgi:hypothetical protein